MDKAIWDNRMIEDGDHIVVAVSGGADSMAMLYLLNARAFIYAKNITITAVYIDLGFGDHPEKKSSLLQSYCDKLGVELRVVESDVGFQAHRKEATKNPCFICSRLRRREIFRVAEELNANKIMFGHHKDDVIETLLLNIFFSQQISSMIPALSIINDKFKLMRPLFYVDESKIKRFVVQKDIPFFDQECPTDGHSMREYIKKLVNKMEKDYPGVRENIFKSLSHVKNDYLL